MTQSLEQSLKEHILVEQKLEITVWEGEDDEVGTNYNSEIKAVEPNRFLIGPPPGSLTRLVKYMAPDTLIGVVLAGTKVIIFYPTIITRVASGFWVAYPKGFEHEVVQESRQIRVQYRLDISVDYNSGGIMKSLERAEGKTIDLSASGVLMSCSRKFSPKDEIKAHFRIDSKYPMMTIPARVVFCRENPNMKTGDDLYIMAIQFTGISKIQQELIAEECLRRSIYFSRHIARQK